MAGGGAGGGGSGGGGSGGGPPIPVIVQITAGATHTCVLGSDGTVWCWGDNKYGQLGATIAEEGSLVPVHVADIAGVTRIGAGIYHTCAIAGGVLHCWGRNDFGQAGGVPDNVLTPTPVDGIEDAVDVSAGYFHSCAETAMGEVYCFGNNGEGQLGDGSLIGTEGGFPPVLVAQAPFSGIALGSFHSCASGAGGPVCWGANYDGMLGFDGGPGADPALVPIPVDSEAYALQSKGYVTCGLEGLPEASGFSCWGDNDNGQVGAGFDSGNSPPVSVDLPLVDAVVTGINHGCALVSKGGEVYCWGSNYNGQLGIPGGDSYVPQKVPSLSGMQHIAAGTIHTCAATDEIGAVYCWGINDFGQLGNGTLNQSAIPVLVAWP